MRLSRTASWFTPRLLLRGLIATGLIAVGLVVVGCVDRGESVVAEGDVRDPDPPILELTRSGGCGDVFMWATTSGGDVAVTVSWNRPFEQQRRAAEVRFAVPDDEIVVRIERGRTLERNMCTDLIDGESEPEWVRTATAGRGHLVVGEFDPVTWRARATLTLEGVEGPDGLRFAPAELSTDQIGFFSG